MDFNEYQRMALTTAMYPDRGNNLTYPVLGLGGESGEICEKIRGKLRTDSERKALAKELGDILWYTALVADELGVNLSQAAPFGIDTRLSPTPRGIDAYQESRRRLSTKTDLVDIALSLAGAAGGVCDRVKKMSRDDGGTLTDARRAAILGDLGGVLRCVAAMATELGESLEWIAEMNVEKLASRKRRGTITGDGDDR